MKTLVLEIRDEATCIGALAIKMLSDEPIRDRFLWRYGYPRGENCHPAVVLMHLSTQEANVDPHHWFYARTMKHAHLWITEHFDALKDGDVVDVRVILGEAEKPAEPEIWTAEKAAACA